MKWIRLSATNAAPAKDGKDNKDQVVLLLIRAGSSGVIEGEGAPPLLTLTGYIAKDKKSSETVKRLGLELQALGFGLTASAYKNIGWQEKWKRGIRAVRVGSILIRPTWSRARSVPGEKLIELDPGMAFGTGSHPTTRLCLRALVGFARQRVFRGKANVLDVGTGSGILAIAAKKLGARRVVGTDTDPVALKVARKNARANGVAITFSDKPLATQRGRFDLVMANIISGTLVSLKGELAEKVIPGGRLVLSGILREEAPEVLPEFTSIGLEHVRTLHSGEWTALIFKNRGKAV